MKLLPKIICTLSIFLCTLFVACDKKEPTLTDTPTQTPTPAEPFSSDFETEYNAWKEYIIKKFS